MHVLVVDDAPDILKLVGTLMRLEGHTVHEAEDGQAALDLLRDTEVDAVVTDFRMPRMDGVELMRRVREARPGTRLILLTAYPSRDLERQVNALGGRFLTKPFDAAALYAALGPIDAPA